MLHGLVLAEASLSSPQFYHCSLPKEDETVGYPSSFPAYHSGWRKEEILSRTIDKVSMNEGTIRLDPGETKNEDARTYYMNDEVREDIEAVLANRNPACPYLFQRDGEQIKGFRKAWESARIEAGFYEVVTDEEGNETKVPTKLFHDYRRSAVRDMVRSGISERVAMKISGHKIRSCKPIMRNRLR